MTQPDAIAYRSSSPCYGNLSGKLKQSDQLYMYATVLNSLAEMHLKMGRLSEADAACRRSLAMREAIGNPEKLARNYVTLGEIQSRQGKYKDAQESFARALELKTDVHGAKHPELIPVLTRYAHLMSRQGRLNEAGEFESRAEEIRQLFNLPPYGEEGYIASSAE